MLNLYYWRVVHGKFMSHQFKSTKFKEIKFFTKLWKQQNWIKLMTRYQYFKQISICFWWMYFNVSSYRYIIQILTNMQIWGNSLFNKKNLSKKRSFIKWTILQRRYRWNTFLKFIAYVENTEKIECNYIYNLFLEMRKTMWHILHRWKLSIGRNI